ncbi:uncharacterized protein BJ212DRAFT_1483964 [Suillus subaureus]|uniref:Uncharacterized protein n=1 Tax=Suillus subaureus TaxID=48587 RepID=A0A9P7E4V7_9AGAM|nr:uncharacterized protein BJ212DRAFT_1483964 [Suillus subaureus]KAG1810837.1 hypothetical protein BJ212DRAFT_1483964 [Suillus subaureus]
MGNGCFMLPDHYHPNISLILTLNQIQLYLQHDADLHGGADPNTIPSLVGYDEFAITLNMNAGNGIQVTFINPEGGEGVHITGCPPALAETELMDEALWNNLEHIKKQRQWRERGVSERWAKCQRREDDEAMKPFTPSMTTHTGPSSTSNPASIPNTTPPASSITPPKQPSPLDGNDTKMGNTETTNEVCASKGKDHMPKK